MVNSIHGLYLNFKTNHIIVLHVYKVRTNNIFNMNTNHTAVLLLHFFPSVFLCYPKCPSVSHFLLKVSIILWKPNF